MPAPLRDSPIDMSVLDATRIEGNAESYEVLDPMARGSNADLYLVARRGALGVDSLMVVKRMQESHARDESAVDSFLQEARISVRLRHPNIVTTFGCGQDHGVPYLAMEYLEGGSLRDIAKQCKRKGVRLTPDLVVFIACEVLKGLHHAHTLRDYDGRALCFVHRDLSPHNVIVTFEGWVKLIDFGIAKTTLQNEKTAAGIVKGKCAYVSPEQVVGDPLDPRTDIFSLGIVLWELVTGRRLMNGQSTYEIMMRILNQAAPAPSSVVKNLPPGLDAIIVKALQRDPDERFESADAMRKALRGAACLGGKPPASAEDLAKVMDVLFGEERKERVEAIQRKMALLNAGKRPSDSGPVPRMSDASLAPPPPTSSIRLVRDPRTDEQKTAIDGKSSPKSRPSKAKRELEAFEAERKQTPSQILDFDSDADTRVDSDFRIPAEAIREDRRPSYSALSKHASSASESGLSGISGAWPSTIRTYTEPMPERVASLPPPPMPVPSIPPPGAVETTGPMRATRASMSPRFKRFAFLVTDVLVVALVAVVALRVTGHRLDHALLAQIASHVASACSHAASWVSAKALARS